MTLTTLTLACLVFCTSNLICQLSKLATMRGPLLSVGPLAPLSQWTCAISPRIQTLNFKLYSFETSGYDRFYVNSILRTVLPLRFTIYILKLLLSPCQRNTIVLTHEIIKHLNSITYLDLKYFILGVRVSLRRRSLDHSFALEL